MGYPAGLRIWMDGQRGNPGLCCPRARQKQNRGIKPGFGLQHLLLCVWHVCRILVLLHAELTAGQH